MKLALLDPDLFRRTVAIDVNPDPSSRERLLQHLDGVGDLAFTPEASDPHVVSLANTEGRITLEAGRAGTTTVTVTATDTGGRQAESSFPVSVREPSPGSFNIDIVAVDDVPESRYAVLQEAADRWMSILAHMELPDMPVSETRVPRRLVADQSI